MYGNPFSMTCYYHCCLGNGYTDQCKGALPSNTADTPPEGHRGTTSPTHPHAHSMYLRTNETDSGHARKGGVMINWGVACYHGYH